MPDPFTSLTEAQTIQRDQADQLDGLSWWWLPGSLLFVVFIWWLSVVIDRRGRR